MIKRPMRSLLIGLISKPGFWLLITILVLITIAHYGETFEHPFFLSNLRANLGLERNAFERILYLAPIIWAGFLFGQRGATITSLVALACMLPRAILISPTPKDSLFESFSVFIIGNIVSFTFQSLNKERERRTQLAVLNQVSSVVSQSLELSQILISSIDSVIEVMKVDGAMVFLLDEKTGELNLAAYKGLSQQFVQGVHGLKVGEGFNGRVVKTGEPLYVEDASEDPSLTKIVVREEGIRSQLIVPLKAKGKAIGTLCAITRDRRQFRQDKVDLLTGVANQISVAVDNARLYEQERKVAEQLRASEERYRELFENAQDAIWLHDLQGNIIVANDSFARLTGYTMDELKDIKSGDLITEDSDDNAIDMEIPATRGGTMGRLLEVTLVKKDKSEASVQLSTNPVFSNGQLVAFQHIARDVTEEKRMKENMLFYLQQATRAQEDERKRIARELHDETIQALVVLSRQLDSLASSSKGLSMEEKTQLENLWQQTQKIMEDVRRLSRDLRPATLDRLGLLAALEWLASDVRSHSELSIEVKAHGTERRLPAEVELVLFRIAQEALRNVWKHSQATRAEVTIEFGEKETRIAIKDNGMGFDLPGAMGDLAKHGKLGLAGMQERAKLLSGNLTVESEAGKGTTVTVTAPT